MELNEAIRRIVGQHWWIIFLSVVVGVSAGAWLGRAPATYSAATRLVLDTQDPTTRAESAAIADTAQAIASSPAQVRIALRRAQVLDRDPETVAKHQISVSSLGTSGFVELSVSDRDPHAAAAIANALAATMIQTRLSVSYGRTQQILADLDHQITGLTRRIVNSDAVSRDALVRQRSVAESERVNVLAAESVRPKPSVIGRAFPPERADPSRLVPDALLGGLLGLILGIGLAGLLETIRPTVVGGDALARELAMPLLGTLPGSPGSTMPVRETNLVAARIRLAAKAAGLRNVRLLTIGPNVRLQRLADHLDSADRLHSIGSDQPSWGVDHQVGREPQTTGTLDRPRIQPFDVHSVSKVNQVKSGLVLVSPTALKKTELVDVNHLLRVMLLPQLGLITYKPSRSTWLGLRLPGTRRSERPFDEVLGDETLATSDETEPKLESGPGGV